MTAGAARRLSLVIPGLFGPAAIKLSPEARLGLSLPALEHILARAERSAAGPPGLERGLCALFKAKIDADADAPVAAVTREWDARDAGDGWWLRADPVHLRADRDRIVMLGNSALSISAEERAQLGAELNRHFGAEGWKLDAASSTRWYLRCDGDPRIRTDALPDVLGQDIIHHMPRGPGERHWRGLLNETQMVLHASTVNRAREARGAPPVNSLWFWGGGRLPRVPRGVWSRVWGSDALTRGLAALAGAPCAPPPSGAAEWLKDDMPGGHLLAMDTMREKLHFNDAAGWREAVAALHDDWLLPLFAALKRRRLAALEIYPADGAVFRLNAGAARRWWRRRRSWTAWL